MFLLKLIKLSCFAPSQTLHCGHTNVRAEFMTFPLKNVNGGHSKSTLAGPLPISLAVISCSLATCLNPD